MGAVVFTSRYAPLIVGATRSDTEIHLSFNIYHLKFLKAYSSSDFRQTPFLLKC